MALKANVAANFLGHGWRALMSLAFVPVYIHHLGIKAYGLIGVFAALQAWLLVLDLGLRPALGREMARFMGGAHDAQSIWDLLRSAEFVASGTAISISALFWAASTWLATEWVNAQDLPSDVIAKSFQLMGAIVALQLIETIYTSSIAGLQRQVLHNAIAVPIATVRSVGAVAVLILVSPTVTAYFVWQTFVSLISAAVFATTVYRILPRPPLRRRFSRTALLAVWKYSTGMIAISLLTLFLGHADKIVLSRQLTLQVYGQYALAVSVAGALSTFIVPICAAYYPRLTELAAGPRADRIPHVFHHGAQLLTVLAGTATIMMIVFADRFLLLWTRDPILTRDVAPLLSIVAVGTMLHGLMALPYFLQLAHGWTSLTMRASGVAAAVLVPAVLWAVPRYGATGAAWVWTTVSAVYFTLGAHFVFKRLLPGEKWHWCFLDVGLPLGTGLVVAVVCRWATHSGFGSSFEFILLPAAGATVFLAMVLVCPLIRAELRGFVRLRPKTAVVCRT